MGNIAISIERLTKQYRLGTGPLGQGDFRDALAAGVRRLRNRESSDTPRDLWALRAVTFDVAKGEAVGLIGHNGAGKSTLLKILSRITDPTSGRAWFEGRMGSLLEVGTGFHPELSGRENIFLSGAILGMTRKEVARKFDEIVDFSDVGPFVDTPVKRYSSGMYVRLGFAVAAHLEPEILIVDEVLAVGDANFQRKCMSKMQQITGEGRTILFVSHNMGSVQALCDRAIVLNHGQVVAEGAPSEAAALYLASTEAARQTDVGQREDRRGRGRVRVTAISVAAVEAPESPGLVLHGQTARISCDASALVPDLTCSFTILNQMTQRVCRFASRMMTEADRTAAGRRFTCEIPELPLVPGHYHVNVALFAGRELEDAVESAVTFDVAPGALGGRPLMREQQGVIFAPRHRWTLPVNAP